MDYSKDFMCGFVKCFCEVQFNSNLCCKGCPLLNSGKSCLGGSEDEIKNNFEVVKDWLYKGNIISVDPEIAKLQGRG